MKKIIILFCAFVLMLTYGFDEPYYNYSQYKPVFMLRSELEKSVKLEKPSELRNPGKIYIKDNLIFIVEKYYGIHVIDNLNPEKPEKKAFIHIDGCIDLAVKDNILYADNAVDLISVKILSGLSSIEVTSRIKNAFPELISPDGRTLNYQESNARPENAILVRWVKK